MLLHTTRQSKNMSMSAPLFKFLSETSHNLTHFLSCLYFKELRAAESFPSYILPSHGYEPGFLLLRPHLVLNHHITPIHYAMDQRSDAQLTLKNSSKTKQKKKEHIYNIPKQCFQQIQGMSSILFDLMYNQKSHRVKFMFQILFNPYEYACFSPLPGLTASVLV